LLSWTSYRRLIYIWGTTTAKLKSVAQEAEGLESETNNAIEKAEHVVKDILEKKHVGASKDVLLQTPPMNLPPQPVHSPAYSHSSGS